MAQLQSATFGGGCFWCIEAIFQRLDGVETVISGYAGGAVTDPTYEDVSSGTTGHAEVVQIDFDPDKISYEELVELFFRLHDPTTLNRQGADVGEQYRSVIFAHNEEQKLTAIAVKERLDKEGVWPNPIVTEIGDFDNFYRAEDYHQNYYNANPNQPYCMAVIDPKVKKFIAEHAEKVKAAEKGVGSGE